MTHTYQIEGMHCNSCISKVKKELLNLRDVTGANVQLHTPQATVNMKHHIPVAVLQEAIGRAGGFTIRKLEIDGQSKMQEEAETKNRRSTYKPLFIVFAYITGIAGLSAWSSQGFHFMSWMNIFMAGFFLTFSFFKFLDLRGFADNYSTYDLLAGKIYGYGLIYPFIELGLGISYLTGWQPFYTNIVTVMVMGFSSFGVIKALIDKKRIRCACLGAVFNLPMSIITVLEDLLMVSMALFSLFWQYEMV